MIVKILKKDKVVREYMERLIDINNDPAFLNLIDYEEDSIRMENAMKLASPDAKMFAVSAKVGIPDPNYFGRCFKKYTGKSYSDYAASKAPAETKSEDDTQ